MCLKSFSTIFQLYRGGHRVLLVEETGVPGKTTDLPQVTDKLYNSPSLFLLLRVCFVDRCLSFFVRLLLAIVLSVLLITPRGVATVRHFRQCLHIIFPQNSFIDEK